MQNFSRNLFTSKLIFFQISIRNGLTLKGGAEVTVSYSSFVGQAACAVTINVGLFFNTMISFIVIAFEVFMVIRGMNRPNKKEEFLVKTTIKNCPHCLASILITATRCTSKLSVE